VHLVCSYCRRVIRSERGSRVTDVSHGMCLPCARHFDRLWSGMPVDEYLDGVAGAVVLLDADTRVIAMNQQLAELIGVERKSAVGLRGGEAFACIRSRLPEGCGYTVRCRECAVRRTVEQVARTGQVRERVSGYVDTDHGRVALRITGRPGTAGSVQLTIEEFGETVPRRGDA